MFNCYVVYSYQGLNVLIFKILVHSFGYRQGIRNMYARVAGFGVSLFEIYLACSSYCTPDQLIRWDSGQRHNVLPRTKRPACIHVFSFT